jgi:hypothetical protein
MYQSSATVPDNKILYVKKNTKRLCTKPHTRYTQKTHKRTLDIPILCDKRVYLNINYRYAGCHCSFLILIMLLNVRCLDKFLGNLWEFQTKTT